jgi:hypothetical protein
VVLIDAPIGYALSSPGRLLPTFWTVNNLTKSGSRIYLHDVNRGLERYLVKKYFNNLVEEFPGEKGTLVKFVK